MATNTKKKTETETRDPFTKWRSARKAWGWATAVLSSSLRLDDKDRRPSEASINLRLAQAEKMLATAGDGLLRIAQEHGDRVAIRRMMQALPLHVARLRSGNVDPLAFDALEATDAIAAELMKRRQKPPTSLPPLHKVHHDVFAALRDAGDYGSVARDIAVAGVTAKTKQRALSLLRDHGRVELIEGTRRWRSIGQR